MTNQKYKNHGVCFVLANYSWAWGLTWNVAAIPKNTLLEKPDFLCFSRYQLQIISCLGAGLCVHFSWDFVWFVS